MIITVWKYKVWVCNKYSYITKQFGQFSVDLWKITEPTQCNIQGKHDTYTKPQAKKKCFEFQISNQCSLFNIVNIKQYYYKENY